MKKAIRYLTAMVAAAMAVAIAPTATAAPAATAPATPCTPGKLTYGDCDQTIVWAGKSRLIHVHVPANYLRQKDRVPLLLDLHGFTSTGLEERDGLADVAPVGSDQLRKSNELGFIAVFAEGLDKSWNAYGCCGNSWATKVDDVGFLREVIRTMKAASSKIDPNRVYVTGLSNGGGMAHRMACEAADVVRAVASVSFPLNQPYLSQSLTCNPAKKISETEFRGTNDETVFYYGPIFQPATWSQDTWRAIDGCNASLSLTQIKPNIRDVTYTQCLNGTRVGLVTIVGGTHVLYKNKEDFKIADYIWDHVFNQEAGQ